jgi:hypothetical protein
MSPSIDLWILYIFLPQFFCPVFLGIRRSKRQAEKLETKNEDESATNKWFKK